VPLLQADEAVANFVWPLAKAARQKKDKKALHKPDPLLESMEDLIVKGCAWCPIGGATVRSEPDRKLETWIDNQMSHMDSLRLLLKPSYDISFKLTEFPRSSKGKRVITCSRTIAYLVDSTKDFVECLSSSFGIKTGKQATNLLNPDLALFLYVSNSIESGGRAFSGDPFTGQVAAYSKIMCYDLLNAKNRNFVVYYPHQLYSQFFSENGKRPDNKGVKIIQANVDLVITAKGVLLEPEGWSLL
jgi:hypothetical protein